MPVLAEATYNPELVMRALLQEQPAEIRFATDLAAPIHWFLENFTKLEPLPEPLRTSKSESSPEYAPAIDPWLVSTLNVICECEAILDEASPDAQSILGRLDTAEHLAAHLATMPSEYRPQLMVDADGHPSFASSTGDFYLHLSVDEPGLITWYATVGDTEFFEEGVRFNGRQLPEGLKAVFAA
jgi:hypothetical protein